MEKSIENGNHLYFRPVQRRRDVCTGAWKRDQILPIPGSILSSRYMSIMHAPLDSPPRGNMLTQDLELYR